MQPHTLGNDIVDLASVEPPLNPRYIPRVCTPPEQAQIRGDAGRLWLHWAAKEAAYKALRRHDPGVVFIPRDFRFDSMHGTVCYGSVSLPCRIEHTRDYIHIVASSCLASVGQWVSEVPSTSSKAQASEAVRALAVETVGSVMKGTPENLKVSTADGVPTLIDHDSGVSIPLSFSHHGRFVACAALFSSQLLPHCASDSLTRD